MWKKHYLVIFSFIAIISFNTGKASYLIEDEKPVELKRDFSLIIQRIANRNNIELTPFTHEWCLQLKKENKINTIFYYDFDINSSGSYQACKDKATTSQILSLSKIPCVEHKLFISPSDPKYAPKEGVWPSISRYAEPFGYKVVCKMANGSSGTGINLANNLLELENLYIKHLNNQYDFYITPYLEIEDEYRVIMLGEEPQLVYRKVRPEVIGDGMNNIRQLFMNYLNSLDTKNFSIFFNDFVPNPIKWDHILEKDKRYPLKWKHNLEKGGIADTFVPSSIREELINISKLSIKALNINFASIDIIRTEGKWLVLEANAGIMMKFFMNQRGSIGINLAESIYERAICKMFGISPSVVAENMYRESISKLTKTK